MEGCFKVNEREKHNMMKQISVEDREEEQELRKRLYSKKYLSQIIEEEKPEFKSNNLILAPVGSGKRCKRGVNTETQTGF